MCACECVGLESITATAAKAEKLMSTTRAATLCYVAV